LAASIEEDFMADFNVLVLSGIDFEREPIRLIEVGIVHGNQRRDVILSLKETKAGVVFTSDDERHPLQYHYRAYAHSGPFTQGPQSSFEAPPRTTNAQTIVIDPRELYRVTVVNVVNMMDPERYRAAFVDVKVEGEGWSATETVEVGYDRRDSRLHVIEANTSKVAIQRRIRYVTRPGAMIEGAWQPIEPGAIVVANPAETAVGADR
jgi:putative lipase involved disintegration of autophagic bodies